MNNARLATLGRDHHGRVYQPGEIPAGSSVPACLEHYWVDQDDAAGHVVYTYCEICGLRPAN